jgi:hypothetical protein
MQSVYGLNTVAQLLENIVVMSRNTFIATTMFVFDCKKNA